LRAADQELLAQIEAGFPTVGALLEAVRLRAALAEAIALARAVNGYLDRAPWFSAIKNDREAAATTVFTALRAIDSLKVLLAPFLPFSSERLHRSLGYDRPLFGEIRIARFEEATRSHEALVYDPAQASGRWAPSDLQPGQPLQPPEPLYKKLDEAVAEVERHRLGESAS
jgi:methionyl-tRNA synthetase